MPDKEIFVLKIVWKKSIASLHRLTQAVQRANLKRTAGDPTWVWWCKFSPIKAKGTLEWPTTYGRATSVSSLYMVFNRSWW